MKELKNEKGVSVITLLILIIIALLFLYIIMVNSNNTGSTSSVSNTTTTTTKESYSTYTTKCKIISYESLARNPNLYKGNDYRFTGEVIQVMNDGNDVMLRVNVTRKKYDYLNQYYYDDTILVSYTYSSIYESKILEDDIITIYGKSVGTYTYTSVIGASVTVPAILAMYIDIF